MSGNSTPRATKRTPRFRMTLTTRTVAALEPEEKTNVARRSLSPPAGGHLVLKVTTCPHFVRNAVRCGDGARNPAEFLASLPHPRNQERHLSSCRNRIESIPRPRLAFHVLVIEIRCFPGTRLSLHRPAEINGSGPTPHGMRRRRWRSARPCRSSASYSLTRSCRRPRDTRIWHGTQSRLTRPGSRGPTPGTLGQFSHWIKLHGNEQLTFTTHLRIQVPDISKALP